MWLDVTRAETAPCPPQRLLELDGRTLAVDEEGFLLDSALWSPAVAEEMAETNGLVLGQDHWVAINFLRGFYQTYAVAPDLYMMQRALCNSLADCRWTRSYLKELFPAHGAKDACRYAGLPKPHKGVCG